MVSAAALSVFGPVFPVGTLFVNVAGSFLLGGLTGVATSTDWLSPTLRLALTTGVMGGFTTYSTFNQETLAYFQSGTWGMAALNLVATVALCLAAGVGGIAAARALV